MILKRIVLKIMMIDAGNDLEQDKGDFKTILEKTHLHDSTGTMHLTNFRKRQSITPNVYIVLKLQ